MALPPVTPRDQLQRVLDLARKTSRYWWLIAVFVVLGGGLSLVFAVTRPLNYQSWSTLFYQERIQSQLLSPGREEIAQRNIGDRYRELLLARHQLDQITIDPALDPYPQEKDPDVKIDKLRLAVRLEAHGANVFRIVFTDSDPERAKRVTEKLTKMLQDKDEALRNEQAAATVAFVTDQQESAREELKKREKAYTEFLAKHPEFVQDANAAAPEGASIRAIHTPKATPGNSRLYALERQRARIQASLDAPPGVAPAPVQSPRTPERVAAEAAVQDAQRELNAARRELEDALAKYTELHPAVARAKERVESATQRLRQREAAVPPEVETVVRVATPEDRTRMQKELQQLEAQIAAEQSKSGGGKPSDSTDAATSWVVKLEGEHNELRRAVAEQRERVQSLADSAFRAQMDANEKLAEQGGRLAIIDPPFKPARPTGPGKTIFLLAGMVLFLTLGLSLAVGLAVIDDRLYRRADLDRLGVDVLAVIPPAIRLKRRSRSSRTKRLPKVTHGGPE